MQDSIIGTPKLYSVISEASPKSQQRAISKDTARGFCCLGLLGLLGSGSDLGSETPRGR